MANEPEVTFNANDPDTYVFLAYACVRIKATHPELWKGFVEAFDSVLNHHGQQLGMMPPDPTMTIYSQGRVKALLTLSKVIDNCSQIVRKYENKQEIKNGARSATAARTAGN